MSVEIKCTECDAEIDNREECYCHGCWSDKDREIERLEDKIRELSSAIDELAAHPLIKD